MKKLLLVLAVVLFASNFIMAQEEEAAAGSIQNFTVVNNTGIVINDLYVAFANEEEWGEDMLGAETLGDGESIEINFEGYSDDQCSFDVMIGDTEGNYFWLEDVNLCEIHELQFTADNKKESGK